MSKYANMDYEELYKELEAASEDDNTSDLEELEGEIARRNRVQIPYECYFSCQKKDRFDKSAECMHCLDRMGDVNQK